MKRKIIQFITNLSDGGAETLVKDYALLLDHEKFDVVIVTIRNVTNTSVYKILKEHNVKIINVYPNWNIFIKVFNKIFGKKYIDYKLNKIIDEYKPDVIHAHLYVLKYLKRISKSLDGIKLFYTCHSIVRCYFGSDYPEQTESAADLIKKHGMRLIALHKEMSDELNELFHINDTVIVKNGIDLMRFENSLSKREMTRKQLGIDDDVFLVGHVGRFTFQKNHIFLLSIFKEIKNRNPNAKLLLVGSGPDEKKIINKIKELNIRNDVIILSHRTDIPELMSAMDVFVFPSIIEGFGIVLAEAQAAHLRCIVSEKIPNAAYLSKYIIPVYLSESIEKWCDIILDKDLYSEFDNRLSEYDMNKEIRKLEELYSE